MKKQHPRTWRGGVSALSAVLVVTAACQDGSVARPELPATTTAGNALSMMNSAAPFQAWHQGFNHGTGGWIGSETAGPGGWCGTIEARSTGDGPLAPSAGSGYAVVRHGPCNDYWAGAFPAGSGPYSPGAGYGTAWPEGGWVAQLDVYLDPGQVGEGETLFTLAASVDLLQEGEFHYFFVPVTGTSDGLSVDGIRVTDAGWYTFRHVFSDEDGALRDTFELARGQQVMGSSSTDTGLDPADVSSGYLWFVAIKDGVDLPIDEHRVRRGG
ncbi:MAG: hypothetical protein PVJ02_17395 [Gemmatimonadota bacterium]|jgi:hypothetical protein